MPWMILSYCLKLQLSNISVKHHGKQQHIKHLKFEFDVVLCDGNFSDNLLNNPHQTNTA